MLALTRLAGEAVRIGDDIWVVAVKCQDGRVKLGIHAPRTTAIVRDELLPFGEQWADTVGRKYADTSAGELP